MKTKYADRPIVTMFMGSLSRLSEEVFGSSMTFGAVVHISAPGQIPVDQLSVALSIIHESI